MAQMRQMANNFMGFFRMSLPFRIRIYKRMTTKLLMILLLSVCYTQQSMKGQVSIDLMSHAPKRDIAAPENATHYMFFAAADIIDFSFYESTVVRQA